MSSRVRHVLNTDSRQKMINYSIAVLVKLFYQILYVRTVYLLYSFISANNAQYIYIYIYRVSQEECAILRESVPYVKLYRYNPKHLYPNLNGYGDNGQISLKL